MEYPLRNKKWFPDYLNFTVIPSIYLDIRMQFYTDRRKSINTKLFRDIYDSLALQHSSLIREKYSFAQVQSFRPT
jgi:hypothetical protein